MLETTLRSQTREIWCPCTGQTWVNNTDDDHDDNEAEEDNGDDY